MKIAREGYVTIKTLPHYGEKAVPTSKKRLNDQQEVECEFILLDCKHGVHKTWLKRSDI